MQHPTRLHGAAREDGNEIDKTECVVARMLLSDSTADNDDPTPAATSHLEGSNVGFELYMDERRVFFERILDGLVLNEKLTKQLPRHIHKTPACLEVEWRHLIDCLWHIHSVTHTQYQKKPLLSVSD